MSTVQLLDGAVCIINDGQIPRMKGRHCGPDERLCVRSLCPSACFYLFKTPFCFCSASSSYIYSECLFHVIHFVISYLVRRVVCRSVNGSIGFSLRTVLALLANLTAFDERQRPFVFILEQ